MNHAAGGKFGIADVGVWLQPTVSVRETAELAQQCDECGFGFLGMTDGPTANAAVFFESFAVAMRLDPLYPNILLHLGPKLNLAPADEAGRLWVNQMQGIAP